MRAKKQKGGGRQLSYAWAITFSSSNSGSVSADQTSSLGTIKSELDALSSSSSQIKVTPTTLGQHLMDVYLDVTVNVTNFLGLIRTTTYTVKRENKDLPQLVLSTRNVKVKASKKLVLKGMLNNNTKNYSSFEIRIGL